METELNEKLQDAYNKLLQAKVDRRESDREVKLKEALANLRKVFPGTLSNTSLLIRSDQSVQQASMAASLISASPLRKSTMPQYKSCSAGISIPWWLITRRQLSSASR